MKYQFVSSMRFRKINVPYPLPHLDNSSNKTAYIDILEAD